MAEAADTAPPQQRARVAATATTKASDVFVSGSAWLQQVLGLLFPTNLAAKAALFVLVVALLPLLPSGYASAPRIWELPHLLLLGIIISYGVFGQKNNDNAADQQVAAADIAIAKAKPAVLDDGDDAAASVEAFVSQMMQGSLVFEENDAAADDGGGASKDGGGGGVRQAWSSRYLPDDPLVVVADTSGSGSGTTINSGDTGEIEKPLLLPVRKLQPPPPPSDDSAAAAPAPAGYTSNGSGGTEEEEEEELLLLAPKAAVVRERSAIPSPSSVLDADLTLSPSSSPPLLPPPPPPPPPPFLGRARRSLLKAKARSFNGFGALGSSSDQSRNGSWGGSHGGAAGSSKQFRCRSAVQQSTRRSGFGRRYDPVAPVGDDEADDDETLGDEMVAAASDSSFGSDIDDDDDDTMNMEENNCEDNNGVDDEDDGNSCDEELFELATRPGPEAEMEMEEVEDEVDRKADEFIAKFREQIRMQRVEPARR